MDDLTQPFDRVAYFKAMIGKMQCKHIHDLPILKFLDDLDGRWASWFGDEYDNSVTRAMPLDTPGKLVLAKMRMLMRRGLVDGCDCGCRGDFVITRKGREWLSARGVATADVREAMDMAEGRPPSRTEGNWSNTSSVGAERARR